MTGILTLQMDIEYIEIGVNSRQGTADAISSGFIYFVS